jgi:HD-like signal output (HDOD) protein
VLRCVNSAAYGLRMKVSNLQHAVAYLGVKQVRNLATTAAVSELFRQKGQIGPYSREGLWKHMVTVGLCGRMIALRLGLSNFEDIFLAGLLHDVGIILEDQHLHPYFVDMIEALPRCASLCEAERQFLGFDHRELGEGIALSWRFPETVCAAIRHHHMSPRIPESVDVRGVRCVDAADVICTLKGIPSVGLRTIRCEPGLFEQLGLGRDDIAVIAENLDQEIARNSDLFSL